MTRHKRQQNGLTLIEILVTLAVVGVILAAIGGVVGQSLTTETHTRLRYDTARQARFAMARMVKAVTDSEALLLPLVENSATAWSESLRDPGVLAVNLDPLIDRDAENTLDADNDGDGQVDEDVSADAGSDSAAGIPGIDDDNDGSTDEGNAADDDEDGSDDEDPINDLDDDGDGSTDEDPPADSDSDGAADDDGDGSTDEDRWDPVVFYLNGTDLIERSPSLTDVTGDSAIDGRDYTEHVIAENVSQFSVERLSQSAGGWQMVEIVLELSPSGIDAVRLEVLVRVGANR